jgi:hypothetical protein
MKKLSRSTSNILIPVDLNLWKLIISLFFLLPFPSPPLAQRVQFIITLIPAAAVALFSDRPIAAADSSLHTILLQFNFP